MLKRKEDSEESSQEESDECAT